MTQSYNLFSPLQYVLYRTLTMIRESVRDEISCLHPHKPEYLSRTEVLALLKIGEEIDKALGFRKRMILDFN